MFSLIKKRQSNKKQIEKVA